MMKLFLICFFLYFSTVIKEPPYQISQSGYAGFELPIEIYFRNKEEPKKVQYTYDLFLKIGEPCTNAQQQKLTFQNPNADFKKKLLKAGGVSRNIYLLLCEFGAKINSVAYLH